MADNTKKQNSILRQVAVLFTVGVILIGLLTSLVQLFFSYRNVKSELAERAEATAKATERYLRSYPAYEWLIRYWYEHRDELDVDYDVSYTAETENAAKYQLLLSRHPDFQGDYADVPAVEALPEEDQKLYAEVVYSWLITHIDGVAEDYNLDYLFGIITDEPYDNRMFFFIASKYTTERADEVEYGKLYPIGSTFGATAAQQEALRRAVAGEPQIALNRNGQYVDYYYHLGSFDGHELLIGVTRDVASIRKDAIHQIVERSLLAVTFLIILAVVCLLMILRVVLRPLKQVGESIRLYKNTKDSETVLENLSKIKSRNEIAELSHDVADLAREIDDYTERIGQITMERERTEVEMSLANRIQTAMLPKDFPPYPDRTEFDIYASMEPAREVGGDFYDYFFVDDNHLTLVIADVSGKGVPAALFMMASKITLSHYIKMGKTPAQVLAYMNAAIVEKNPAEMFITIWLGILDLTTGKLTASNAGHEYPMLMEAGGNYELIKDKHGFVVGSMAGVKYSDYELTLKPGSKLFVYTDGLPEATDANGEMFGTGRVLGALNADREAAPKQTLENVACAVNDFVKDAEQFDDLTMMCVIYNGPAER